jgi:hypothetical protein
MKSCFAWPTTYERRTGTEYIPTFTKLSYETYSNQEAWDEHYAIN